MKRTKGFTLIELLVVIAIIAILAAILFPVFNSAKLAAKRAADSASMASIYTALAQYREDQGGYPPLLLGVTEYLGANLRPANQTKHAYLYPSRVKDIGIFKAVLNQVGQSDEVGAFWPTQDPRALAVGEVIQQRQFYGPSDPVRYFHLGIDPSALNGDAPGDVARFYAWDSWDVTAVNVGGALQYELRYCLFWTEWGQGGGDPNDEPRQLGYNNPPDETIVTWNSNFRPTKVVDPTDPDFPAVAIPRRRNTDLVLYLSGTVRPVDSRDMFKRSWRFGR